MSAASRHKATAPQRERRRVAWEIAKLEVPAEDVAQAADFILRGVAGFDVARAREHALSLIRRDAPNVYDQRRVDLGLAIQRALKGQPSECLGDDCSEGLGPWVDGEGPCGFRLCPSCHGSGHNLRGVLPAVEVSPQLRYRLGDQGMGGGGPEEHAMTWLDRLPRAPCGDGWSIKSDGAGGTMRALGARAVPRGTHRDIEWGRDLGLDQRITDRRELWAFASDTDKSRLPRWRRGELRHAEQRRERVRNV